MSRYTNRSWKYISSITPTQISVYFSFLINLFPFPFPLTLCLYMYPSFKLFSSFIKLKLQCPPHLLALAGTCIQVQTKARQTQVASVPWNSLNSRWLKGLPWGTWNSGGAIAVFQVQPARNSLSSWLPGRQELCAGLVARVLSVSASAVQWWETGWCYKLSSPAPPLEVTAPGPHVSTSISAFSSWTEEENPTS